MSRRTISYYGPGRWVDNRANMSTKRKISTVIDRLAGMRCRPRFLRSVKAISRVLKGAEGTSPMSRVGPRVRGISDGPAVRGLAAETAPDALSS